MVVEPFEFDDQGPQPVDLVGQLDAESVFDRQAVRERVRCRRVAADAFGEIDRGRGGAAVEEFLDATVHKPQPRLQPHDRLARDRKPEVTGFDEAGVHRPDRNLVHAGSFDGEEREGPPYQ